MARTPNMHLDVGAAPGSDSPAWGNFWFDTTTNTLKMYYPPTENWVNFFEFGMSKAPYVGDETEKNVTGMTPTSIKQHRILSHGRAQKMYVVAELKATAGTTGFLGIYLDGGLVLTLQTQASDYELVFGSFDISMLTYTESKVAKPSVPLLDVRLWNSDPAGVTTNRLYDLYYAP